MALRILRPDHLHVPARVLSCTAESGRVVTGPVAGAGNAGELRLRASAPFQPTADTSLSVALHTGGRPAGYAIPGVAGSAPGACIRWKNSTDGSSSWRGYTDTPYLVRVAHPIAWGANHGPTSTPRQLADGYLGVFLATTTTAHRFYRVAPDWSQSSALVSSLTLPSANYRVDFVVLASGRLVAGVHAQGGQDGIQTYYSDDDGATWAALGYSAPGVGAAARDILCMEAVGDDVVALLASSTGAVATNVLLSRDGGATFTSVDTAATLSNPRTCVRDGVVLATSRTTTLVRVRPLAPGGGFGDAVATTANAFAECHAIACRDDGVLWALGHNASNSTDQDMEISASLDGGLTWASPAADPVLDLEQAAYGTVGIDHVSAGTWRGHLVVIARANSNAGSDNGLHFLVFGEWATVTDGFGGAQALEVYQHSYVAIDYPHNVGWTRASVGAGCTLTNRPWLSIVGGAGNNDGWTRSGPWWPTLSQGKARMRLRVNSGGNLGADEIRLRLGVSDGVDTQRVTIRFATTGARLLDGTGATIGSDLTLDFTAWVDLVVALGFDSGGAGVGKVSIWYRRDTDAQGVYTSWQSSASIGENAGLSNGFYVGGTAGGNVDWDLAYLGASEAAEGQSDGQANPADLAPRPLSATWDAWFANGVHLGGYNTGGVTGDTYTVATTFEHAKEDVWREHRPSRQVRAGVDKTTWDIRFDAGSTERFRGTMVALFGTNFRVATLQLHTADSWGAPSATVALDATVESFTIDASSRGPGYLGPGSSTWRHGEYRSDGDAHRWFVEVDGIAYEIADNDQALLYVEGVDFSAATGTAYIFGDRAAATTTLQRYRYMRLLVASSQDTADDEFRLGFLAFGTSWTPAQLYDHGFVDRVEPRVALVESDSGHRQTRRAGPRRSSLAIQWPPVDTASAAADLDLALRDLYSAIEGSHQPIVVWRDDTAQRSLGLYRVLEAFAASNVWGEHGTSVAAVTRVDQLVLSEEL